MTTELACDSGYLNLLERMSGLYTEGQSRAHQAINVVIVETYYLLLVEYATYGMSSQLFVQKYQLYLPNRDELRRVLENTLQETDNQSINP